MSINPATVPTSNLPAKWAAASLDVVKAIKQAASATGVSFDYLMDKAKTESAFDPDIKAKTSSATGLFQFIDSTWLQTLKDHGAKYGLGDLVDKIDSDPAAKKQALDLRKDPDVAAVMTAEATKDNQYYLQTSVGGDIGKNELYLAHFLGLGGATKFLQAKQQNPQALAADLFPSAANANRNVFYDASGKKKSLTEVYDFFAKKMDASGEAVMADATSSPQQPAASAQALAFGRSKANTSLQAIRPAHLSPLNPALMARLSGITPRATEVAALTHDLSSIVPSAERNFIDIALGRTGNPDNSTLGEGKLIAPFTAMILAKLATVRDAQEQGPDDKA